MRDHHYLAPSLAESRSSHVNLSEICTYIHESFFHISNRVCKHAIRSKNTFMTLQKDHVAELTLGLDCDLVRIALNGQEMGEITRSMCL